MFKKIVASVVLATMIISNVPVLNVSAIENVDQTTDLQEETTETNEQEQIENDEVDDETIEIEKKNKVEIDEDDSIKEENTQDEASNEDQFKAAEEESSIALQSIERNVEQKQRTFSVANEISSMRVNNLVNPYGLETSNIRFSWQSSIKQSAYRIVISKSKNAINSQSLDYDSGWVSSDDTADIKVNYSFSKDSIYYWMVQLRSSNGNETSFSDIQSFSTEVSNIWSSQGIWASENDYAFFRYNANIQKSGIDKAVLTATALSPEETRSYVYDFYVNGTSVGMGPTRNDSGNLYYDSYDITSYLNDGNNVLAAQCYSEGSKAFMCQLDLYYVDGTKVTLANTTNDSSWKTLAADSIFGNNGDNAQGAYYYKQCSENINGDVYPQGWNNVGYDDSQWSVPTHPYVSQSFKSFESEAMHRFSKNPQKVSRMFNGNYLVDFGKEVIGSLSLSVNGSGQSINIRYGEELNSDGSVRDHMITDNKYNEIWKLGYGQQNLSGLNLKAFRYVQISNLSSLSTSEIAVLEAKQDFDDNEASFSSNRSLLNSEYEMGKYTIKVGNQNLYVDTQSRERQNYMGDTYINMMTSFGVSSNYSLMKRSLEYALNNPTWPAEYRLYSINGAYKYYLYTGDTQFLQDCYSKLVSCLNEYSITSRNLIGKCSKTILVDWPIADRDNYKYDEAYYNTVINAVYVGACNNMANIAQVLGKNSSQFTSKRDTVKNAMINQLYDPSKGYFYDGLDSNGNAIKHYAQQATMFSLAFGVYNSQSMANTMASMIEKQGLNKTSVYGSYFVLQGLYESGNGTIARKLLTDSSSYSGAHTWQNMLNRGNGMATEGWDSGVKTNMSYSHPWGSGCTAWLVQGLFGITPTSAAYKTFDMKIQTGGVSQAKVKVPTLKGSIDASYTLSGNNINLSVNVPMNTTGRILLPYNSNRNKTITVNGTTYQGKGYNDHFYFIELSGGNYTLSANIGDCNDISELKGTKNVIYQTTNGIWGLYETDGSVSGTTNEAKELKNIRMFLNRIDGTISYQAHVAHDGWLDWKSNGQTFNTSNGIQAFRVKLEGNASNQYDVYYRAYCQTYGWLDWAKNGITAGTVGQGKRLEAIEVKLVPKGQSAPGSMVAPNIGETNFLSYQTHVQTYGWQSSVSDGETAGTTGQAKRLEAMYISLKNKPYSGGIRYRTHIQTYGWESGWKSDGQMTGTSGQAKRLEAIQIELTGEMAQYFDVYYRVHAQHFGWLDWAKNGESAGTEGYAYRLEGIQIVLVAKGRGAPGSIGRSFCKKEIGYQTHVQTYGWQGYQYDGDTSGTTGQAKRLEGIKLNLNKQSYNGGIQYRTHVQTYGWESGWKSNGTMSGTCGQAKRLEAIQIRLTGEMANHYDVYYRVHAQKFGWMGWAKNGESAGSAGYAYRLEGIQIVLVKKGGNAPGSTANCYQEK